MSEICIAYYPSSLGPIRIKAVDNKITELLFVEDTDHAKVPIQSGPIQDCINQLDEYFSCSRHDFDMSLFAPEGTEFQQKVWRELIQIPFGKTISYLDLARKLGDEKVIRAAANANGANPIAIAIPCHRVIGSDGSLTGYAGGLHRKRQLLDHEARISGTRLF